MNPMMQAIVGSGLGSITMPLNYSRIRQLDSRVMSLLPASTALCPLDLALNLHHRVIEISGLLAISLAHALVYALWSYEE
jgi:hypothetical protein